MIIAVNAGHCPGLDPGACGDYSQEADIVRDVAKIVCNELQAVGHIAQFIQEDDLGEVCEIANCACADLFVSIHCNAAENPAACGTETFYYADDDDENMEDFKLAGRVQQRLLDCLGTYDRGLKDGSWLWVLRQTNMPAILTEIAFISNPEEEKLMNDNIYRIGVAIANGIRDYINLDY